MKIVALISLLMTALPCWATDNIKICAENNWPPFSFSQKGEPTGASLELIETAFKFNQIETTFDNGSYNRCLKLTQSGQYDAMLDVAKNKERTPQFIWPKTPFLMMKLHLIANKDVAVSDVEYSALAGKRVGLTTGYEYPDAMLAQPGLIRLESPNELANLRQLAAGKIDFMLLSEGTVATLSSQLSANERKQIKDWGVVDQLALYLAFSPKAAQAEKWADLLDQGLIEMQKKGEDKKILTRWHAVP
jgi:polar amino acid transport system substrate-binding protein